MCASLRGRPLQGITHDLPQDYTGMVYSAYIVCIHYPLHLYITLDSLQLLHGQVQIKTLHSPKNQ